MQENVSDVSDDDTSGACTCKDVDLGKKPYAPGALKSLDGIE